MPRNLVDQVIADLDQPTVALGHLAGPATPTLTLLRSVVDGGSSTAVRNQATREQHAGAALVEAETRMQRGLRLLAACAATAPLLGLLGTVTGMITSFRALNVGHETSADAGQLSGGIGEALLTTEFGLIVAVPLLLAHAIFARDAQRRRAHAESAAMRVLAAQHSLHDTQVDAVQPRGAGDG